MSKVTNLQNLRKPLPSTLPHYEMRARRLHGSDSEIELWQLPASATPHIKQPTYVAGLRGRNLSLIEHRLLRRLKACRIDIADLPAFDALRVAIDEEMAINLGLLFRALAPMRNREHMASVAAGIEEMSKEEAGYWLGMAMHRKNPRRVLMALRFLLIDPSR
ncbi:MAG: hypothetical protein IPJ48_01620 [Propionivibrio sp.]|uniref:DUF7680 domain-containing protein n=1 Tax=Candidatus Propionivibrio dominans TaxID=2954373 RepID=A0A9D7FH65_9RHOO|nr:hypothetical protein [Candidatus Propionivibrio dominans]